jgi:hypothetical protein
MADADDDWSDLEAVDEPVERMNASGRESSTPSASAGGRRAPGKRRGRHNDDGKEFAISTPAREHGTLSTRAMADFESQQSILKWVRQVPGPLQDVMKKQADQYVP